MDKDFISVNLDFKVLGDQIIYEINVLVLMVIGKLIIFFYVG